MNYSNIDRAMEHLEALSSGKSVKGEPWDQISAGNALAAFLEALLQKEILPVSFRNRVGHALALYETILTRLSADYDVHRLGDEKGVLGILRSQIWQAIQKHGYYILVIEGPLPWAYSLGLAPELPELIITGRLDLDGLADLLDKASRLQREQGKAFETSRPYQGIVDQAPCFFERVDSHWYKKWAPLAVRWHNGEAFAMLQLIWLDEDQRYPGTPGFPLSDEPLLSSPRER